MIILRNLTGAKLNQEEEKEAVKSAQGTLDQDGQPFEIIELRHKINSQHKKSVRGFQNTEVSLQEDGENIVRHHLAGSGNLLFVPNKMKVRTAWIAKTPWNVETLKKSFREKNWRFLDPKVEAEIKKMHDEWWETISPEEKDQILLMEKERTLTPFQVPKDYGQRENIETTNLVTDNAKKDEEIKRLKEALLAKDFQVKEQSVKQNLIEDTEASEPITQVETLDSNESVQASDFDHIHFMKIRKVVRELNIQDDRKAKKSDVVKKIMEVGLTKVRLKQIIEG